MAKSGQGPAPDRDAVFTRDFLDDLRYWVDHDRRIALRVLNLVDAILRDPFVGVGKPEPLRHLGSNFWSPRINDEHRVVYRVRQDRVEFLQARYHFE